MLDPMKGHLSTPMSSEDELTTEEPEEAIDDLTGLWLEARSLLWELVSLSQFQHEEIHAIQHRAEDFLSPRTPWSPSKGLE